MGPRAVCVDVPVRRKSSKIVLRTPIVTSPQPFFFAADDCGSRPVNGASSLMPLSPSLAAKYRIARKEEVLPGCGVSPGSAPGQHLKRAISSLFRPRGNPEPSTCEPTRTSSLRQ
ncbi:unnamed protein product, partial [Phaeothamnion confervicola]